MLRLFPAILAIFTLTLAASCDKDSDGSEESILHGTWTKGAHTGDTLVFFERGGKHIMKSNQSFNPGFYAPSEQEYRLRNGKLFFKYVWSGGTEYSPIESFTWKVPGRQFEVEGIQLFMFMSATMVNFTFHKVP